MVTRRTRWVLGTISAVTIITVGVLGLAWQLTHRGDSHCTQAAGEQGIRYSGLTTDVRWFPPGWDCHFYGQDGEEIETITVSLFS